MNNNFDAATVALQDSNLIEASAGTGKTYSIAIMVLRLLIEQRIALKKVLMVTFTKAAVAELEERVRLFVKQAHKSAAGKPCGDARIDELVAAAAAATGKAEVLRLLQDAVLLLDETSVLTIHSFCQQTLTEYAFETNQLFGSETLNDLDQLIDDEVNKFWRAHITMLRLELLQPIMESGFKRADIRAVIKEHLSGKRYFGYNEQQTYTLCDEDQVTFGRQLRELEAKNQELQACVYDYVAQHADRLRTAANTNPYARKAGLHLVEDPENFIKSLILKKGTGYAQKLFSDILEQQTGCDQLLEEKNELLRGVVNTIYCQAIGVVTKAISNYKQRNSLLAFDDMIVNLHRAVVHTNTKVLVPALQQQYKAVFVDEFQDTDKLQYEIFHTAFGGGDTILFYIGDPKQSIYSWRKADIFTYFKAGSEVQHRYSMNTNYRSSNNFIAAMNTFFKPHADFDTFNFKGHANAIEYVEVEAPEHNAKGELCYKGRPDAPLSIFENTRADEVFETVAAKVLQLLTNKSYTILKNGQHRNIEPSDIGILVRKNKHAAGVKAALARRRVPAVTIDDTKILAGEEAIHVRYLLEALMNVNRSTINKALLSPFTGYTPADLLVLNEEVVLSLFRTYKNIWDKDGIYSVLMRFVTDYSVRSVLLQAEDGERKIANLFQVIEVLHKVQSDRQLSAPELLHWLQRGINGMAVSGDEFEQRVESDEEAVKIVTIHKSKGLEYNIVFAPFLDLTTKIEFDFCSFRDNDTGEYLFINTRQLDEHQKQVVDEQTEQENRRLIYVAITRALYKCYINKNTASYYNGSSLDQFLGALPNNDPSMMRHEETPELNDGEHYVTTENQREAVLQKRPVVDFSLLQPNWRRMSYTGLAAQHALLPKRGVATYGEGYDQFIFKQLPKGNKTGNLLHYIFENVDFVSEAGWSRVVTMALKRFMPRYLDEFAAPLLELLHHVMHANISIRDETFTLSSVPQSRRLNELEFDFNVGLFDPASLADTGSEGARIEVKQFEQVEGIMNGKMDMFFEHKGRYYILDWKSNYLGDLPGDYEPGKLFDAMSEHNYHLQYLIYIVAAHKYLRSRIAGFDYNRHFGGIIYMFVRGVRAGQGSGIFTTRPSLQRILGIEAMLA